jgi:phage shock protein PspC (stress-responsive transcriptional regulator)
MEKRLYRPIDNRVLAGVCAGFAEYFALDPVLVRLGWILLAFLGGPGLALYIIAWAVMPDEDGQRASLPWLLMIVFLGLPFFCAMMFACMGLFTALFTN